MKVTLRSLCEMRAVRIGLCHWEEYSNSLLTCVWNDPVYEARFERELEVIEGKGFSSYLFIIYGLVKFAKHHMLCGPGRGSSAGSLVCYLLGITTVDPIKWGLLFERFLAPGRSDMPDVDLDVSDERRDNPSLPRCSLFNYMSRKYGDDHVARLGTTTYLRSHSALNVVCNQSLKIPKYLTDEVAAAVIERSSGDDRPVLEETFDTVPIGQTFIAKHPEARVVTKIEGSPFTAGTHACGLVLTNGPVIDYTALNGYSGTTMCDGQDAVEFNLLKIDVLGLSQLSIFERCLAIVDPCMKVCSDSGYFERLPLDDKAAFDVINQGKFSGIFQFQGGASQELARQVHIENIEDLAALTALVRPGPTNSGETAKWVSRKNGEEEVTYPHPLFEPILAPTLGCIIYQESVMRIAREVGGMGWEDVTKLRKAIGKKQGADEINKYREMFVTGAQANGVNTAIANKTFDEIVFHGNYSFNRCIAGDTLIRLGGHTTTIADMYARYVEGRNIPLGSKGYYKKHKMPTVLSMFDDGRVRPQLVKNIHKNGLKRVFKYTFDNGAYVTCTQDHRFIVNGKWRIIGDAKVGDQFSIAQYEKTSNVNGKGHGHVKGKVYKIRQEGFATGEDNPGWINGATPIKNQFKAVMEGKVCEDCGELHNRMEAHHNDFQSGSVRPADLAWLCPGCHKRRHYANGRVRRYEKGLAVGSVSLQTIEDAGWQDTYDLEMSEIHNYALDNGLITHNSHAVAYAHVSYFCCYLKAHHPVEFAAATLDKEGTEPDKQLTILRELYREGVNYVSVDPSSSIDRWSVGIIDTDGNQRLIGPLTSIKGIGPAAVREIMEHRVNKTPLREGLLKKLTEARTDIDDLFPVMTLYKRAKPNLNIVTRDTAIEDVQAGVTRGTIMIVGKINKCVVIDENESARVAKRGGREFKGPTKALQGWIMDDSGEIFFKVGRVDFERLAPAIIEHGNVGKAVWALKGYCPENFRMLDVKGVLFVGDLP